MTERYDPIAMLELEMEDRRLLKAAFSALLIADRSKAWVEERDKLCAQIELVLFPSPQGDVGEHLFRHPTNRYERSNQSEAAQTSAGDRADDAAHDETLPQVQSGSEPEAASSGRRNEPVGVSVLRGGTPSLIPDIAGVKERLADININPMDVDQLLDDALRVIEGLEEGWRIAAEDANRLDSERMQAQAEIVEWQAMENGWHRRWKEAKAEIERLRGALEKVTEQAKRTRELVVKGAEGETYSGLLSIEIDARAALGRGE
jgi:hypothetical protein